MLRPPTKNFPVLRDRVGLLVAKPPRRNPDVGIASAGLLGLSKPVANGANKVLANCHFELPLDSIESRANSSNSPRETSGDSDDEYSESWFQRPDLQQLVRWNAKLEVPIYMRCSEFEMGNNSLDANNSGQGVDMQNLPSIAEQMERQRTWMTLNFRYRMNWYEAKPALSKMTRETAYRTANLPLWTRCVRIQLRRKTNFLHGIRAFRNRMQCATSGVRFTMNAFYRDHAAAGGERKQQNDSSKESSGPEPRPLPYFKCPDDMPDIKTMVSAQLNIFVSNNSSFFDQFWDECLKETTA